MEPCHSHPPVVARNIPPDEWAAFLDEFSRRHHGQPTRLRTIGPQAQVQVHAKDLPLIGAAADRAGRAQESIRVILGTVGGQHVGHVVMHPRRLRAAEWNDGYSGELTIESASGNCTVVQAGPSRQLLEPGVITDGILR